MLNKESWIRMNFQPCMPLGDNRSQITACEKHIVLSLEAARESIVLLKNTNSLLPLKSGTRLAVFGKAQVCYIKGGGGSGDVHCSYVKSIYDGLKEKVGRIKVFDELSLYYAAVAGNSEDAVNMTEPEIPREILERAKEFTDTAVITIHRTSAEDFDRKNDGSDPYYELSVPEKQMIETVCENFKNIIVMINSGAMISTSWFADNDKIGAALMLWQGGMEGGRAAADVLTGEVNPSGKLCDTCAAALDDYPSTAGFHESEDYVKYNEDIFVGYRYFETVPGKDARVVYPFGYGLSYTTFDIYDISAQLSGDKITVSATVKNTGDYAGKEVVQVYYSAPRGLLTKPRLELCSFEKTRLLAPGDTQTLFLTFDIGSMASYDDIGAIEKSAYVLEKGAYKIYVGNSVRSVTKTDYEYTLSENVITERMTQYCAPTEPFERLTEDGSYAVIKTEGYERKAFECEYDCPRNIPTDSAEKYRLADAAEGKISLDEFISQLTDNELMLLLKGRKNVGMANTGGMGGLPEYGIPAAMTTDGPAGIRTWVKSGVRTTAFPVATALACTWNTDLVEKIGAAGALEAKENNLYIWLTPGLNIHRNPLCGRNFEYYSEDPFFSGKLAAAAVRGIQSQGLAAVPKHFACNNKETNRMNSNSIVSERALREIYLKGFEICVKEADPKIIMTSYNLLNGVHTSENAELITGILRREWGYKGLVTTDWDNRASHGAEIIAGNDIRMPAEAKSDVEKYYSEKKISRNRLAVCVKRLLEMLLRLE